jgi:hypothetical protein
LYIDYQDTDIDCLPQSTFTPNGECGLKPLVRALRKMNDRELKLSIMGGFLFFIAALLDLLARHTI